MTLKYYNSYLNIAPSSPMVGYREDLQANINDQFDDASNYLIIQKQNSITGLYEDLEVRLTVPYELSQKYTIKDDARQIIFKNNAVQNSLGDMYQFNGYYWLTIDTGRLETPTSSCQVERCNSVLKFYDANGVYNETPCISQMKIYDVQQEKFIWIPDNQMRVLVKYNDISNKIDIDRRFIINGLSWRVGSKDVVTYVRNNNGYVEMFFKSDFISSTDDLINGIADALIQKATYKISILNGESISANLSTPLQLNIQVEKIINGISTITSSPPPLSFNSSNDLICTVDSNGLCTFLKTGNVTVTAKLVSDETVYDSVDIVVYTLPMDNYLITLESVSKPDEEIKLNTTKTYVAKLYNNSILINGGLFDFVLEQGSTPSSAFVYTVLNDNSVSITCKQYIYDLVLVAKWRNNSSVSGEKSIRLRGLI